MATIEYSTLTTKLGASVGPVANTETAIISRALVPGTIKVGDTFKIIVAGLHTNTTTATSGTYRVRIGTASLSGAIVASLAFAYGATARTDTGFRAEAEITFRSIGASGTAIGVVTVTQSAAASHGGQVTSPVTIDTTAATLIELTYISGGATTTETFLTGTIEAL